MFERLSDSFQGLYRTLSGQASISEKNVADAMASVRHSLLEADVHMDVVNSFCDRVLHEAKGRDVLKSLKPAEQMIGIVHEELVKLLGGSLDEDGSAELMGAQIPADARKFLGGNETPPIMKVSPGPTIVMMCGLQGSGKTTTTGKIAGYLKKRGRTVMVAAADLQRPAAVEQLETVAQQVQKEMPGGAQIHFYSEPDKVAAYGKAVGVAVGVCQRALEAARAKGVDVLILDTAGRLHINDALMGELSAVQKNLQPHHIFLVVDAMTGQDAVNSAREFHKKLEVDGIILTKFDSDTRGGAAISVKQVTGAPIKFIGTGEKLDMIEEFHAKRIAGRILGMGDVVSLVERAQEQVSEEDAKSLNEKMSKGQMTLDDFVKQMKMLRRMGPLKGILGMLPGAGTMLKDLNIEEKQLDRVEAMVGSMTKKERLKPDMIDNARRRRIAKGSGTKVEDVAALVKQFLGVNELSRRMSSMSAKDRVAAVKGMSSADGGLMPGLSGMPGLMRKGSSASTSIKAKFKKRK